MTVKSAVRPPVANLETKQADNTSTWANLLELWMGGAQAGEMSVMTPPFAVVAGTAEQMLQICQGVLETNQRAADAIWNAARRQQELAFTATRAALAVSPGLTTSGGPRDAWQHITAATREVGDRSREAVQSLTDAALAAQRCAMAVAAAAAAPAGSSTDMAPKQP